MTETTATDSETTTPTAAEQARADRKRFSFGPVWSKNVLAGVVNDQDKLIAHGVKLKAGSKSELKKLKFPTLLAKVQTALQSGGGTEGQ